MNRSSAFLGISLISILWCSCGDSGEGRMAGNIDSIYGGAKFNEHIRSTEALTPEEERKGFKLPEGFEISLYASEPDIGKPINFSFDAQGRMWVTESFEYPFAAATGQGKDRVTILEDTDHDGKADKFTHFNDTLNIPIGVIPTGKGAMVYSIPNVYHYADQNRDGKAESGKKIMGPFETRDTHGMVNNFTWGFDGWIHACHGYANRSVVAAADGDSVHLISGNTIRFRTDGSRVEQTSAGRINPFGLSFDEWGYLYSTDCHTSPMYQLVRGGDYSQWGKDEGMGFAPDMKSFEDEATALAGLAYYADNIYPEEYQKNFYYGDAVSSRVYRNSATWKGASPIGKKEDPFVLSADPWFRPVDVKMGPDGALYIADFYNSIIGHYEVPLDHPKRDRIRGRIWRITYKGKTNEFQNLETAPVEKLTAALQSSNLSVRILAANQLVDRIGKSALPAVQQIIADKNSSAREYSHALWVIQRLQALDDNTIIAALEHEDPVIRVHALRTIREQKDTSMALYPAISKALSDNDPHVQRAASEAISRYVSMTTVENLIAFRKKIKEEDTHSIYTVRLMLRNLLRQEPIMEKVAAKEWSQEDAQVLTTVLVGVEIPSSGVFLYNYVKDKQIDSKELPKAFKHIIRFVPEKQISEVIVTGKDRANRNPEIDHKIFRSLQEGLARRGAKEPAAFVDWGKQIVIKSLEKNQRSTETAPIEVINEVHFAIEAAGNYRIKAAAPYLIEMLRDTGSRFYARSTALKSLLKIDVDQYAPLAGEVLRDTVTSSDLKRDLIFMLGEFPQPSISRMLASLENVPVDQQQGIVIALSGTEEGRRLLFEQVRNGKIFARTLVEPRVEERLMMNLSSGQKKIYEELTANVEKIDAARQSVIAGRYADYVNSKDRPSPAAGEPVFVKNCSPCHNIKGKGGAIGPQLDGVGKWGVGPLMEKILDPNRNISENFRTYTLKLKNGKVLSGLYRRDEGQVIVFADAAGVEFSVPKQDIAERNAAKYTLMPDQFVNTIPQDQFNALISYLLAQK